MKKPIIKSRKQLIRIWFEFYKLCLSNPQLQDNLKKSKTFYEPWGDVEDTLFDKWWEDHKGLFGDDRIQVVDKITEHPNVIHVSIPLNVPITTTLKKLKEIVDEKQKERLENLGKNPDKMKSNSVGFGDFEFTSGLEVRGKTLNENLIIFEYWRSHGQPPINSEFCIKFIEHFRNRPRSKWIPFILQIEPETDKNGKVQYTSNQLRQVRRYKDRGQEICVSVSLGEFPGRSSLT